MVDTEVFEHSGFWEHVGVLRNYLLLGGFVFVVAAIAAFAFSNSVLIELLLQPLHGQELIFLSPLGPFLFEMKVAIYTAILVSFPFWLVFLYLFIAPALPKGRRIALLLFGFCSIVLGAASLVFTYFYFVPTTLTVLRGFAVPGTVLSLTAENYLSFYILEMAIIFFIVQLPVIIVALSYVGILNPNILARNRRYVIVGLVILLAILTPTTDVITLAIVSVPAVILVEIGIFISKLLYTRRKALA
jgi:sec-independent protein translocase protein TatC